MSDPSRHREDPQLFGAVAEPSLRAAARDLAWLLSRGYGPKSALKLVGDRHALEARQRRAVACSSCSDQALTRRLGCQRSFEALAGRELAIDGYNLLITLETALAGKVVFLGRDGCARDLASVHGTYVPGTHTPAAIAAVAQVLADAHAGPVRWYFDRPVAHSGELRRALTAQAAAAGWPWTALLEDDPDRVLMETAAVVASSDGGVLDHCSAWTALGAQIIARHVPQAWIVDLRC